MKKLDYVIIIILSLIVGGGILFLRSNTGYMDADYYYATAREIYSGNGIIQNFLWNFLDQPQVIPHPAFTYWMPLSSFLAVIGMWMANSDSLLSARIPFVLLYSLIPAGIAFSAYRLNFDRSTSWVAALLAVFAGYYSRFITEPDSFGITMILGTSIITLIFIKPKGVARVIVSLLIGISCGLMHSSRADGVLWVIFGAGGLVFSLIHQRSGREQPGSNLFIKFIAVNLAVLGFGYLLVMLPWYLRNIVYFDSLFPSGNFRTIFLTEYDQLFAYPPDSISINTYLSSGFGSIMKNILSSFGNNLLTAFIVQGNVVMLPLAFLAFYKDRKNPMVIMTVVVGLLIFLFMGVLFPFAGKRGGYLHSSAALQPLIWIYSAQGLRIAINWGIEIRKWDPIKAMRIFSSFMIFVAIFITSYISIGDYIKIKKAIIVDSWKDYQTVDRLLTDYSNNLSYRVMVNNPAAYNAASRRQAVILPYGNLDTINQVAEDFDIDFLVIDRNHIAEYREFYTNPGSTGNLQYLDSVLDYKIYRFQEK